MAEVLISKGATSDAALKIPKIGFALMTVQMQYLSIIHKICILCSSTSYCGPALDIWAWLPEREESNGLMYRDKAVHPWYGIWRIDKVQIGVHRLKEMQQT